MKVYPEEYKWGEICKDSTPFCLIYSVSFSELPRILVYYKRKTRL